MGAEMKPMTQGCAAHGRSGQAMIEYVIVAVSLLVLFSTMAALLYATKSQAKRAAELVSSEYP